MEDLKCLNENNSKKERKKEESEIQYTCYAFYTCDNCSFNNWIYTHLEGNVISHATFKSDHNREDKEVYRYCPAESSIHQPILEIQSIVIRFHEDEVCQDGDVELQGDRERL